MNANRTISTTAQSVRREEALRVAQELIPEWQKERIKMTHIVFERILDPIMLFAETLTTYDEKDTELDLAEIGATVRLLALDGMTDLMMFGMSRHVHSDALSSIFKEWIECDEEYRQERSGA